MPPTLTACTLDDALAAMQQQWGYPSFRPGQQTIIEAVLDGRDVLGVLPTGGGKSLCYQVPALLSEGIVLVISPLIALMHDQVDNLRERGIEATYLNSTLSYREIEQRWTDVECGRYRLLYMAPERLTTDRFEARAHRLDVSLLAVDEAHCVSEWGHHFRPDYLKIVEARQRLGDPPTLAVTATATPPVRRDVIDLLDLDDPAEVVHGFDRPNLIWSVFETRRKRQKVRDVLNAVPGSGILYASTRRSVEQWAQWLRREGVDAGMYHGGMQSANREAAQTAWVTDKTRVMVATNAFGMGIDKPDVRFVIHVDLPASLEAYYQEAGRGGRDGERAYAVLLFQLPDAETQAALIDASHPSAREVQAVYDAVCNAAQVPVGSDPDAPLVVNPDVVTKITGLSRGAMRTALDLVEREEAWTVLPPHPSYGAIRFLMSASRIRAYADDQPKALTRFVHTLLRTVHADAFSDWWRLNLGILAERTELEDDRLRRGLNYLARRHVLEWRPPGDAVQVKLSYPRTKKLPIDGRRVRNARKRAERRLDAMLRYARSVACRRHFLLTYFGESHSEHCGSCDVCLGRHRPEAVTGADEPVLRTLLQCIADDLPRADWFDGTPPVPRHRVDALLRWLVDEGYLRLDAPLEGRFALTDTGREMVGRGTVE
mgnify:CR=1 FL=1